MKLLTAMADPLCLYRHARYIYFSVIEIFLFRLFRGIVVAARSSGVVPNQANQHQIPTLPQSHF